MIFSPKHVRMIPAFDMLITYFKGAVLYSEKLSAFRQTIVNRPYATKN